MHHPRQQGWQKTFRMERARGFFQAAVFQGEFYFESKTTKMINNQFNRYSGNSVSILLMFQWNSVYFCPNR